MKDENGYMLGRSMELHNNKQYTHAIRTLYKHVMDKYAPGSPQHQMARQLRGFQNLPTSHMADGDGFMIGANSFSAFEYTCAEELQEHKPHNKVRLVTAAVPPGYIFRINGPMGIMDRRLTVHWEVTKDGLPDSPLYRLANMSKLFRRGDSDTNALAWIAGLVGAAELCQLMDIKDRDHEIRNFVRALIDAQQEIVNSGPQGILRLVGPGISIIPTMERD